MVENRDLGGICFCPFKGRRSLLLPSVQVGHGEYFFKEILEIKKESFCLNSWDTTVVKEGGTWKAVLCCD